MPRNPKPGKPLAPREAALAKALPGSSSIAEAGRRVGMSPQAADDAFAALKIKAPERCAQLGISRDKVFKRFDEWADGATKFIRTAFEFKEVPDIPSRIRSNKHLKDIFEGPRVTEEAGKDRGRPAAAAFCLVVTDKREAAEILGLLAPGGAAGVVVNVGPEVHEDVG